MPPEHDLTESERPRLRRRADGTEYLLGDETLVGRGLECDILISDSDSISRRHARLFHDGDGLSVSDLGSTNGTHLNGREVTGRTALSDGDVLAFDEYEFDVIIPTVVPAVEEDPGATRIVRSEPEQTRVVSRADVLAHIEEATSAPPSAEPASAAAAEAHSPATEKDEDRESWPSPSIADEMADGEWTWPENEGDGKAGRAADDDRARRESTHAAEPADGDAREAPASDAADPVEPGPAMVEAPPTDSPPAAAAPAEPPPSASAEAPAVAAPDPAPAERAPAATDEAPPPHAERPADPPSRRDERPPTRTEEEKPEAAAAPFWAQSGDAPGAAGHTMIVKSNVPRSTKAPPPVDRESLHGPTLVVGTDDPNGQLLSLDGPDTEWVIGSDPDSDLRIDHESVSARHAVLSREGGKWRLSDELSANGTYANGSRINVGYVGDGHALRFGTVECILMIPKGGRGRSAAGRAPAARAAGPAAPRDGRGSSVPWKMIAIAVVAVVLVAAIGAGAAFYLMSRP